MNMAPEEGLRESSSETRSDNQSERNSEDNSVSETQNIFEERVNSERSNKYYSDVRKYFTNSL